MSRLLIANPSPEGLYQREALYFLYVTKHPQI